ncbi:MAG: HAD family hydrolase [Flavobacteriaceae bacterium]|nr:HAD family hydrolase [Flavobacteriaceae bacterium]
MIIKVDSKIAVVFDLDDTLYYELDYLISAYREIAVFLDKENEKMLFVKMFSMYRNQLDVFGFLTAEYDVEKMTLIKMYRNHYPKIKLNEGVLELFEKIKNYNGKIGLITDGRAITQRNKIKALGIEDYIDFVSISEEVGFEKPHRFPFENMMDNLKQERYCYIADNVKKDFITPNKMNWETIGLIDCGKNIHNNVYKQEDEYLPKNMVYSLKEIKILK